MFKLDSMLPFALLFFSLVTGGDIMNDIIGIISGHIYYYFKDLAPTYNHIDVLITPEFL